MLNGVSDCLGSLRREQHNIVIGILTVCVNFKLYMNKFKKTSDKNCLKVVFTDDMTFSFGAPSVRHLYSLLCDLNI